MEQAVNINLEAQEGQKIVSRVAMTVVLISFSMLFATFFLGFAVYRLTADQWPPRGMDAPALFWPLISTLVIVASSFSLYKFQKNIKDGSLWLLTTRLMGLGFMLSQIMVWRNLNLSGLFVGANVYTSMIYAFTWTHFAHMVIGVGLLFWISADQNRELRIENVSKFWHFLSIVWIAMFSALFGF